MTQLTKRRKASRRLFPSLRNDFLTDRFFIPSLLDFDDDYFDTSISAPPANITETEEDYILDLSVPGMKKDDFKVDIDNGVLTIHSEKEEESKEEDKNYRRREFSYSSFSRSFTLPDNVDEDNIKARYENGMLQVSLPKKEISLSKSKKEISIS